MNIYEVLNKVNLNRRYESLFFDICTWFNDFISPKAIVMDGFFALRAMELFAEQKSYDVSAFPDVLDRMVISDHDNVSCIGRLLCEFCGTNSSKRYAWSHEDRKLLPKGNSVIS